MKTLVIKLGGSLVSRGEDKLVDFNYLKNFSEAIRELIKEDYMFFIAVGGGYAMRMYRDLALAGGIDDEMQLHWIGTTTNVLNAEIVRAFMHDICSERIFAYEDYYGARKIVFDKPVIVGGGGRAGHSGDKDALEVAKRLNVSTIISLKNVDGVYNSDPKLDPKASKLDELSWEKYMEIIKTKEHKPGANFPVDPVTSVDAMQYKKKFIVIAGDDIENFKNAVREQNFEGSVIS